MEPFIDLQYCHGRCVLSFQTCYELFPLTFIGFFLFKNNNCTCSIYELYLYIITSTCTCIGLNSSITPSTLQLYCTKCYGRKKRQYNLLYNLLVFFRTHMNVREVSCRKDSIVSIVQVLASYCTQADAFVYGTSTSTKSILQILPREG